MRKLLIRPAALLVSVLTALALLLGSAAPAQAVAKPPAPTSIKRPGCETLSGTDWFNPCKVRASYDNIKRLTTLALKTTSPAKREGIIRYELLSLFGNVAMWGDHKKIVPTKDNFSREALDAILTNIPAPSNAVVRCYGNWMMYHVATRGASSATIQNFYQIVTAIKDGKEAYGTVKAKVKSESKYIDALSKPAKVLEMLRNERTKELINKTFGVNIDKKDSTPSDMADGYIRMILDSRQAVTQAQYSGAVQQLFHNIMGDGDVRYSGCQNIPAPPKYVTKTASQTFTGAQLTSPSSSAVLVGGVNPYDRQHAGYCNPVGTQLQCKAYDSTNALDAGAPNTDDALRLNLSFDMPDAIKSAVPGSAITMQVTTSLASSSGTTDWEYGEYATTPRASGTFSTSASNGQSQTLGVAQFSQRVLGNVDYWLHSNATLAIQSVKITYTYTAQQ